MLRHSRSQHPVGHGGFHTGIVDMGGSPFHYVYDCGSVARIALKNAIEQYVDRLDGDAIDVLFLSHLDADHVSGLDQLLACVKAKTAVLPYLTPAARLILVARAAADQSLSTSLVSLWADPTAWLTARGIDSVVYMTAAEPPQTWEPIDRDILPTDIEPGEFREPPNLELDSVIGDEDESLKRPAKRYDSKVNVIPCSHPLRLRPSGGGRVINWQFVTHVHPEGAKEADFQNRVRRECPEVLGRGFEISFEKLLRTLQNPASRDRLASCYTAIRSNRNLTTLSLYSGLLQKNVVTEFRSSHGPWITNRHEHRVGWLGTGDANLKTTTRRKAFLSHFNSLSEYTFTFALPHHGSARNFNTELLNCGVLMSVSAGDRDPYGHPHTSVVNAVHPWPLHVTTEKPSSELCESCQIV